MTDRRKLAFLALLGLGAAVTSCSDPASGRPTVEGKARLLPGWAARLDDPAENAGLVELETAEKGYRVTVGPNVILWHPENRAEGSYRIELDVDHLDSLGHAHGAGLIFGGAHLDAPEQTYTYFLVRGDGQFLVKTRDGAETREVTPWTAHAAIHPDDAQGIARNRLAVEVRGNEVHFLANDTEVHRAPAKDLHTAGVYGFRLVHNLVVEFGEPVLTRAP